MRKNVFALFPLLLCLSFGLTENGFKQEQLKYERVKTAYSEKGGMVEALLKSKGIAEEGFSLFIRIIKADSLLEVWVRKNGIDTYSLLKNYKVCALSGTSGPKRKQGDLQVPEGFYHINMFNPVSNFYLSLGINYPNASDKILKTGADPGGSIFIHGNCVTIGCIPITDDKIKELYVLCVEAKDRGQANIPVYIFPCRMQGKAYERLISGNQSNAVLLRFWSGIKPGWDYFEQKKRLPLVSILNDGSYSFR